MVFHEGGFVPRDGSRRNATDASYRLTRSDRLYAGVLVVAIAPPSVRRKVTTVRSGALGPIEATDPIERRRRYCAASADASRSALSRSSRSPSSSAASIFEISLA